MKLREIAIIGLAAFALAACGGDDKDSNKDKDNTSKVDQGTNDNDDPNKIKNDSNKKDEGKKDEGKKDEGKKDEGKKDEGKKDEDKKDEGKKDDKGEPKLPFDVNEVPESIKPSVLMEKDDLESPVAGKINSQNVRKDGKIKASGLAPYTPHRIETSAGDYYVVNVPYASTVFQRTANGVGVEELEDYETTNGHAKKLSGTATYKGYAYAGSGEHDIATSHLVYTFDFDKKKGEGHIEGLQEFNNARVQSFKLGETMGQFKDHDGKGEIKDSDEFEPFFGVASIVTDKKTDKFPYIVQFLGDNAEGLKGGLLKKSVLGFNGDGFKNLDMEAPDFEKDDGKSNVILPFFGDKQKK